MSRPVCTKCTRPLQYCYCNRIPVLSSRWQLVIFQHQQESTHPLNTARIASLSLISAQVIGVGDDSVIARESIDHLGNARHYLLYPGEESLQAAALGSEQPGILVCIDASWKKSRRLLLQSPWLQSLPRVAIAPSAAPRYRIRKASSLSLYSTLEAIVYSLGQLEQDQEKYLPLLDVMDWMVEQQLQHYADTDAGRDA